MENDKQAHKKFP